MKAISPGAFYAHTLHPPRAALIAKAAFSC